MFDEAFVMAITLSMGLCGGFIFFRVAFMEVDPTTAADRLMFNGLVAFGFHLNLQILPIIWHLKAFL
jgi:hypothetical protein